jgi:Zn-dependent peptidase ImmA (M78 family)
MSRVAVSPGVLKWAQERSGVSTTALRKRFGRLAEWESGETRPTLRQLEDYARMTFTPLGYLFLDEPPEEIAPIPTYRTVGDGSPVKPSPDLLDTIYSMLRRQDWMRDYLIQQGCEPFAFVGSTSASADPRAVAQAIRQTLDLGSSWASRYRTWTAALDGLMGRAEAAGVLVMMNGVVGNNTHRALDPNEFRGFVLSDSYAPLVFLNGADGRAAQMFTLAHELAHVWIGNSAAFDLRLMQPSTASAEIFCDAVAAEFLLPESELRAVWPEYRNAPEPFEQVAQHFKVSSLVGARRALDLHLIGRDRFFEFYEAFLEDTRRTRANRDPGGDFYNSQPNRVGRRFGDAVVRAVQEGRLLYRDAYALTGLRGPTFDEYAGRRRR